MNIAWNVVLLVVAIFLLWKGADRLVESATVIAWSFGISDLVIGLTVVAMGTSAPEFAVTVSAALKGHANISVANVVGSNIFNLGFILGGVALFRSLAVQRRLVYRDGAVLIAIATTLLFFIRDHRLSRWEGAVLMTGLLVYLGVLYRQKEGFDEDLPMDRRATWRDGAWLLAGFAAIILGGHWLVESASTLARAAGISEWVIGVTIVAAGTSAPEFFTSLVAVLKGRHGLSAGNLIGSDIYNMLGVLGLAAMLHPLGVERASVGSVAAMLAMIILVVIMMRTGWRLSRWEGALLIALNLVRWVLDFAVH